MSLVWRVTPRPPSLRDYRGEQWSATTTLSRHHQTVEFVRGQNSRYDFTVDAPSRRRMSIQEALQAIDYLDPSDPDFSLGNMCVRARRTPVRLCCVSIRTLMGYLCAVWSAVCVSNGILASVITCIKLRSVLGWPRLTSPGGISQHSSMTSARCCTSSPRLTGRLAATPGPSVHIRVVARGGEPEV